MAFKDYLTYEGERILAKAASGTKIQFTRVVIGSGSMPEGADVKSISKLYNQVKSIPIKTVKLNGTSEVSITAYYNNSDLDGGFYLREKGIFATDGVNEVLAIYGYSAVSPEYIDVSANALIEKKIISVLGITSEEMANIAVWTEQCAPYPIIVDDLDTIDQFVTSSYINNLLLGQVVIVKGTVYTYVGNDPEDVKCYSRGGAELSDVLEEELPNSHEVGASQYAAHQLYKDSVKYGPVEGVEQVNPTGIDADTLDGHTYKNLIDYIASKTTNVDASTLEGHSYQSIVSGITEKMNTEIESVNTEIESINNELKNKAASSHTHSADDITSGTLSSDRIPTLAASKITSGTFASTAVKAATGTDYTTARVRNIYAGTTDMTAGTTSLSSGDIYVMYE